MTTETPTRPSRPQPAQKRARSRKPAPTADDRGLEARVVRFLQARRVPGAAAVQVESRGGTVVLSGTLPSGEARRLCIQCCQYVAGVLRVVDRMESEGEG